MIDQFIAYDAMLLNWLRTVFNPCFDTKTPVVQMAQKDRAFAETDTPTPLAPAGRPALPRVTLTNGDPQQYTEYFNPNRIRKLGYSDTTRNKIRSARYPKPVTLPYQLNIWTEYQREMNRCMQAFWDVLPGGQFIYLPFDVDAIAPFPCYGIKDVGLFAEGGFTDTGKLEPGKDERYLRRSINLTTRAWIWDFGVINRPVILDTQLEFYDKDSLALLEKASNPRRYELYTADGVETHYGPIVGPAAPIVPGTFFVDAVIGGDTVRARDNGTTGALIGFGTYEGLFTGSVDYDTATIDVQYTSPPDVSTKVIAGYRSYIE